MIETAMFFVAGFTAAALIFFFISPMIWQRAVRLTTRRVKASLPYSIIEVEAVQDQLRAENATKTRDLEKTCEKLRQRSAELQMEAGRQVGIIDHLKLDVEEKSEVISTLEKNLSDGQGVIQGYESLLKENEKRIADERQTIANLKGQMMERETQISSLIAESNAHRIEVVALKTQAQNALEKLQASQLTQNQLKETVGQEHKKTRETASKMDGLRADIVKIKRDRENLETSIANLRSELNEKDETIKKLRVSISEYAANDHHLKKKAEELDLQFRELSEKTARDQTNGQHGAEGSDNLVNEIVVLRAKLSEQNVALASATEELSGIKKALASKASINGSGADTLAATGTIEQILQLKGERETLRQQLLEAKDNLAKTASQTDAPHFSPANDADGPNTVAQMIEDANRSAELDKLRREVSRLSEELKKAKDGISELDLSNAEDRQTADNYADKIDQVAARLIDASAEASGKVHEIDKIIENFTRPEADGASASTAKEEQSVSLLTKVRNLRA